MERTDNWFGFPATQLPEQAGRRICPDGPLILRPHRTCNRQPASQSRSLGRCGYVDPVAWSGPTLSALCAAPTFISIPMSMAVGSTSMKLVPHGRSIHAPTTTEATFLPDRLQAGAAHRHSIQPKSVGRSCTLSEFPTPSEARLLRLSTSHTPEIARCLGFNRFIRMPPRRTG